MLIKSAEKNNFPLRVFFGHHKCASEWIIQIFLRVSGYIGLKSYYLNNKFDAEYYKNIYEEITKNNIELVLCQSSSKLKASYLRNYKAAHVVRDPRDICISGYYSHLYSHRVDLWPELYELRKKLKQVSFHKGLFLEMEFLKEFYMDMYEWDYQQKNVLEIKLEDLSTDPYNNFIKIFDFLELYNKENPTFLKERILDVIWVINVLHRRYPSLFPFRIKRGSIHKNKLNNFVAHFQFDKLSGGRQKGGNHVTSHYRSGKSNDWINYFDNNHKRYFKDNFGDLLIKLGYEKSMDW
ncbi:MAG: sulfotransferase domain-containing protein [Candidatus Cyclobacteriaceae bacterium M2_1C_046]